MWGGGAPSPPGNVRRSCTSAERTAEPTIRVTLRLLCTLAAFVVVQATQ